MTELPTNSTSNGDAPFEVAVIGAGLVGLNVCLGLLRRNIPVTVYEQATELKEIGAGLGLSSTLEDVLAAIDPAARDAVRRVGIRSPTPGWINGMSQEDHSLRTFDKVYDFEIEEGNDESFYCQRAQLLDELVRCVPAGTIHLKKRVERIVQNDQTGKVSIEFTDGEKTEASAGEHPYFLYPYCHQTLLFLIQSRSYWLRWRKVSCPSSHCSRFGKTHGNIALRPRKCLSIPRQHG